LLAALEDANVYFASLGTSYLQPIMRSVVPGSDNVCDLQSFDTSAAVTESGKNRLTNSRLVVPSYLSLDPILCHQIDCKATFSLAALLLQIKPG
jgi:hypothetical protein